MSVYREKLKSTLPEGESGRWSVKRYAVREEDKFGQTISFIKSGRYVPTGIYTALYRGKTMVMSDTPDELGDIYLPINLSSGVCLVNGLGLGCVAIGMLEKESVKKVIVIEESEDVINLVGKFLKEKYGDRIEIRMADALTYKPPKGEFYNVVWHDIWDNICVDNWKDMNKLHRKYGARCGWQGSWVRDKVKALVDRERKNQRFYGFYERW